EGGRGAARRARRGERARRRGKRRERRDVPGLAGVRVEAGLEEGLAGAGLVGHGGEEPVDPGARGGGADPREEAERAVGPARLAERGEREDDPLRTVPVVHERGGAQLPAAGLDEPPQRPRQAEEPRQEAEQRR